MTMSTLKVTLQPELNETLRQETADKIARLDGVLRTVFDDAANVVKVAYNPNSTKLESQISKIPGVASAKYYPY